MQDGRPLIKPSSVVVATPWDIRRSRRGTPGVSSRWGRSFFMLGASLVVACQPPRDLASPAAIVTLASTVPASLVLRPFGSHVLSYAVGTIQPHGSRAQRDQTVASFYDAWKAHYLVRGCGSGEAYVNVGADGPSTGGGRDPASISISEGHGYGMLISVWMAGYDPDARTSFDALYRFFRDHPSSNAPNLMAWNQITGCGNSTKTGTGSATDGDLDIAYALLLADRQWGSNGAIDYLSAAHSVLRDILAKEVNPTTSLMLLSDDANPSTPDYDGTRCSDFMFDHFRVFAEADSRWTRVGDATYGLVSTMQASYSPSTGLLPDFVVATSTKPQPAGPNFLETAYDGLDYYNACRVPWRIGMDALLSGDVRAKAALAPMNAWIRSKTNGLPVNVSEGYDLGGNPIIAGANAAFVGPFGVSAMVDASNQVWLDAVWDWLVARPIKSEDYYGNTLKVLTMLAMSQNCWAP